MLKLREIRKQQGMTMKQLGERVGVTESAIGLYENGQRKPDYEMLLKLAEVLDSSVPELTGTEDAYGVRIKSRLDKMYDSLDDYGKRAVDSVLDVEYRRCRENRAEEEKPKRIVTLFPAAAGAGEPLDGLELESYETDNSKATFAVRISGDSMEPFFEHGEVVECRYGKPKDGDIAIVNIDGCVIVKQFCNGYNGQFYLKSLNRERADLDYTYLPSGNETIQFYGVVLHDPIPMVDEYGTV